MSSRQFYWDLVSSRSLRVSLSSRCVFVSSIEFKWDLSESPRVISELWWVLNEQKGTLQESSPATSCNLPISLSWPYAYLCMQAYIYIYIYTYTYVYIYNIISCMWFVFCGGKRFFLEYEGGAIFYEAELLQGLFIFTGPISLLQCWFLYYRSDIIWYNIA